MKYWRMTRHIIPLLLVIFFLGACDIGKETSTSEQKPQTPTATPTLQPPFSPPTRIANTGITYSVWLKVTTTSDWSTLRLVSGGDLYDLRVISASEAAPSVDFDGEKISMNQTVEQAEAGKRIELTAEASLSALDPDKPLVFEIDRGYIGWTQVEIASDQAGNLDTIAVFTWDGINSNGPNTQVYEVSAVPFLGSPPNEHIVIAQINFWFYGPGEFGGFENSDGSRSTPLTPLLGETYAAADPEVVYQQIEWAVEYGVDAFSIEWTTPRGIGCRGGSMEDTLDDVFLKSPNIHKVRFAIFYDFMLRLHQTCELNVDITQPISFDNPVVYDTFVADFEHFAKKYFDHPQYLTIDGRPVVYIWSTSFYEGNLGGAVQDARSRTAKLGYDVYIVGDEVRADRFDQKHAALFDANTTFTFLIPGFDKFSIKDVAEASKKVDRVFQSWRDRLEGVQVTGRDEMVNFQPAWAPQYDESSWIRDNPIYVPAMSKDQVIQMAQVARKHAEPAGAEELQLIWLNTWNNWAESTTVEPTANLGHKYPAGNYQFDMLEVVREVFGVETYYTSP